jgi:hypothetical protein
MTRQHVSQYKPPADPYAYARCACRHFVNAGQEPGRKCQYSIDGCKCTDHRVPDGSSEGGAA